MVIGIDNSPLVSAHKLAHKIRGTGYYTKHLIESLEKYHTENKYIFFQQGVKTNEKIDIFHFPYFEPFFLSLPFKKQGKTIVTVHDLTPIVFPDLFPVGIRGKVKFSIQKLLLKKCDAVITDSLASKRDIERFIKIPSEKVFSVYLSAAEHFKKIKLSPQEEKSIRKKFELPEKFALYVGDATPNKNVKRLVDACILSNIPLVLVGGVFAKDDIQKHPWNTDLLYVQKIAKENHNIKILGFVDDVELVHLYNIATVFVFPSLYEGFGLPVLEAAACGCPVITTRGGSLQEVMGDAGCYIDPYDVQNISLKIQEVVNDKKMRSILGERCYEQSKRFSWKATSDQTVKVYEKVFKEA